MILLVFDSAIKSSTEDTIGLKLIALINKGYTVLSRGELFALLLYFSLQIAPDDIVARYLLGFAYVELAMIESVQPINDSEPNLQYAINQFDAVLLKASNDVDALLNKGIALIQLGKLHVSKYDYQAAAKTFSDAVRLLEYAQLIAPQNVIIQSYKGIAADCFSSINSMNSDAF